MFDFSRRVLAYIEANPGQVTPITAAALTADRDRVLDYVDQTIAALPAGGGGGAFPNASAQVTGGVRLSGDLGGTATAPTVPALALKADASALALKADASTVAAKLTTPTGGNTGDVLTKQANGSYAAAPPAAPGSKAQDLGTVTASFNVPFNGNEARSVKLKAAGNFAISFSGASGGAEVTFQIEQDVPGGWNITFPASTPVFEPWTLSTAAGAVDVVCFYTFNGTTWFSYLTTKTTGGGSTAAGSVVVGATRRTFHVDDYGAVGDGTTNDIVAVQAAIDAAVAAGGGTVALGPRKYQAFGPLQTSHGGHSMIRLPTVGSGDLEIVGCGEHLSNVFCWPTYTASYSPTLGHPSCIGGRTPEQNTAISDWKITLKEFTFVNNNDPTLSGTPTATGVPP